MKTALRIWILLSIPTIPLSAAMLTVPGDANIFGAGHSYLPAPGGGTGGTFPPIHLLSSTNPVIAFNVTGSNTLTAPFGYNNPDGNRSYPSQVYPYQGISGITAGSAGFLAGVFLGPEEPADPGPSWLSFVGGGDQFPALAPRLGQLFFIGDGLTGTGAGAQQLFLVPTNATRLFLGFADADGYQGWPGQYQDNAGMLEVEVQSMSLDLDHSPPLIFAPPTPQLVYEGGDTAPFEAGALGAAPFGYQWFKGNEWFMGNALIAETNQSLQLTNVRTNDAGYYRVVITNLFGAVTSAPAFLNVASSAITILSQPQHVINMRGASASFFAFTSGFPQPLRFQWRFNDVNLPFETNHILNLTNIQSANGGAYRVFISNDYNSVTSAPAILTVIDHGPDWFANLQPIEINDDEEAFPYPSSIEVTGLFGRITNLTVSLLGLEHRWPDDIDILLVGPGGQSVMLMSDAGGGFGVVDLNLFYTRDAVFFLPDSGPISSGKVRPTNFGEFDSMPFPAPPGPHGADLSVFHDTDPNGTWSLYVRDDEEDGWGWIANGWRIDFEGDGPTHDIENKALDHWHARQRPGTPTLSAVAADAGRFVAVGSSGTILTSSRGFEWSSTASGTLAPLADVAWGDGTCVAVGGSDILTSTDLSSWTVRTSTPPALLNEVAYGNNTFVAAGNTDAIRVSTDAGLTWRIVALGGNLAFEGVAYGKGRFVAVARNGSIRVSTNGVDWMAASSTNIYPLYAVTYGNDLFVAVGASGTILTSADGMDWSRQRLPSGLPVVTCWDVIHASGSFVCGGDAGILLSSTDGTNWQRRVFAWPESPRIVSLAFNGETFVAVCGTGTNAIYQSDPVLQQPAGIGSPPRSAVVRNGGTTNLSVIASGTSPFGYQWLRGEVPILGATNRTLVFSNTQISAEGHYAVAITNAFSSVTSSPVSLTVGVPPVVTVHPLGQEIVPGGTVTLSIAVSGTPPFIYRWRQPPSVFTILTSSNHQSFWTITNVQAANVGTYGVYVTNDFGFVISRGAQLALAIDADADGLPDAWEQTFGFNTNDIADALLDSDGDGVTNLAEHRTGTNPTNATSVLRLDSEWTTGGVSLRFHAGSNKTYSLQYAEPRPLLDWKSIVDFVARTNNRVESFAMPNHSESRLYRVVSPRQR